MGNMDHFRVRSHTATAAACAGRIMDRAGLSAAAVRGEIAPDDEVQMEIGGPWEPLRKHPKLFDMALLVTHAIGLVHSTLEKDTGCPFHEVRAVLDKLQALTSTQSRFFFVILGAALLVDHDPEAALEQYGEALAWVSSGGEEEELVRAPWEQAYVYNNMGVLKLQLGIAGGDMDLYHAVQSTRIPPTGEEEEEEEALAGAADAPPQESAATHSLTGPSTGWPGLLPMPEASLNFAILLDYFRKHRIVPNPCLLPPEWDPAQWRQWAFEAKPQWDEVLAQAPGTKPELIGEQRDWLFRRFLRTTARVLSPDQMNPALYRQSDPATKELGQLDALLTEARESIVQSHFQEATRVLDLADKLAAKLYKETGRAAVVQQRQRVCTMQRDVAAREASAQRDRRVAAWRQLHAEITGDIGEGRFSEARSRLERAQVLGDGSFSVTGDVQQIGEQGELAKLRTLVDTSEAQVRVAEAQKAEGENAFDQAAHLYRDACRLGKAGGIPPHEIASWNRRATEFERRDLETDIEAKIEAVEADGDDDATRRRLLRYINDSPEAEVEERKQKAADYKRRLDANVAAFCRRQALCAAETSDYETAEGCLLRLSALGPVYERIALELRDHILELRAREELKDVESESGMQEAMAKIEELVADAEGAKTVPDILDRVRLLAEQRRQARLGSLQDELRKCLESPIPTQRHKARELAAKLLKLDPASDHARRADRALLFVDCIEEAYKKINAALSPDSKGLGREALLDAAGQEVAKAEDAFPDRRITSQLGTLLELIGKGTNQDAIDQAMGLVPLQAEKSLFALKTDRGADPGHAPGTGGMPPFGKSFAPPPGGGGNGSAAGNPGTASAGNESAGIPPPDRPPEPSSSPGTPPVADQGEQKKPGGFWRGLLDVLGWKGREKK